MMVYRGVNISAASHPATDARRLPPPGVDREPELSGHRPRLPTKWSAVRERSSFPPTNRTPRRRCCIRSSLHSRRCSNRPGSGGNDASVRSRCHSRTTSRNRSSAPAPHNRSSARAPRSSIPRPPGTRSSARPRSRSSLHNSIHNRPGCATSYRSGHPLGSRGPRPRPSRPPYPGQNEPLVSYSSQFLQL